MKAFRFLSAVAPVIAVWGCGAGADGRAAAGLDLTPPALVAALAVGPRLAEVRFSEPVTLVAGSFASDPPLELSGSHADGDALLLETALQSAGQRYLVGLTAADAHGNTAQVLTVVYGFNPDVPELQVNELTVRGSSTHPDIVELRVRAAGDMAGVVVSDGTAGSWTSRLIFPSFRVEAGEFFLVHFKPQGLPEEKDEAGGDKALSGGLDASATAYDFWMPGSTGLNGNNGVIALYARPGGPPLDAVLYSNRTSASDVDYGGFGTAEVRDRALEIVAQGAWRAAGGRVSPEDAVSPEPSTSTRSMCRKRDCDTDTREDWYVVPTRGATFGAENLETVYVP